MIALRVRDLRRILAQRGSLAAFGRESDAEALCLANALHFQRDRVDRLLKKLEPLRCAARFRQLRARSARDKPPNYASEEHGSRMRCGVAWLAEGDRVARSAHVEYGEQSRDQRPDPLVPPHEDLIVLSIGYQYDR